MLMLATHLMTTLQTEINGRLFNISSQQGIRGTGNIGTSLQTNNHCNTYKHADR